MERKSFYENIEWEMLKNPLDVTAKGFYNLIDNEINILTITFERNEKYDIIGKFIGIIPIDEKDKLEINDTFSNEDLKKLEDINEIIKAVEKQGIADLITYIDISSAKNNVLYLQIENKTVYVGNIEQLEYKMIFLKTILEKEKGNSGEVHLEEIDSNKDPFFRQNI